MTWKVYYRRSFYCKITAESQYLAIDSVFQELLDALPSVNRRDIIAIPENKVWKKAAAQRRLFGNI